MRLTFYGKSASKFRINPENFHPYILELLVVWWCALCCSFSRDGPVSRMKFASLEANLGGGLSHSSFLSPSGRSPDITKTLFTGILSLNSLRPTVLPAKSDSDVVFCLQSYQELLIYRLLVY